MKLLNFSIFKILYSKALIRFAKQLRLALTRFKFLNRVKYLNVSNINLMNYILPFLKFFNNCQEYEIYIKIEFISGQFQIKIFKYCILALKLKYLVRINLCMKYWTLSVILRLEGQVSGAIILQTPITWCKCIYAGCISFDVTRRRALPVNLKTII